MDIPRAEEDSLALDMSPMIDCVFQLLIFFMLSSTFLTPTLPIALPKTDSQSQPRPPEIVVSIDQHCQIFLNRDQMQPEELTDRLRQAVEQSETKTVTIHGDGRIPYEFFVQIFAAASNSGAEQVNVDHELQESP